MSLTLSRSTRFPDLEGIETRRHIFDAFLNIDGSTRFPDLEGIETFGSHFFCSFTIFKVDQVP